MSFIPRIQVTIANNRCHCCDDDSVRHQPKELAVFYKDGKFYAKLDKDEFSTLYKGLIESTRNAIHDFLGRQYSLNHNEVPEGFRAILTRRLPSLEEVYNIERAASEVFSRKSNVSVDSLAGSRVASPDLVLDIARHTPLASGR